MLEEPTHFSYFKAKIPEETVALEQVETSAVVSAEDWRTWRLN